MAAEKKHRILIIDDDPMIILILEDILGRDYQTKVVSLNDDVTGIAQVFRPDLILLDIMTQEANSYEVCRALRADAKLRFTKILMVSSKTLLKDRLKGYEAGADDHLSKPFDRDELLAKVRIFIRLKSVEEIDQVKDDLLNIFSHETRTPLNAIIGFAKLLRESSNISEEEKEFINLILESGMSLLSLSNKAILLSSLRKENYSLASLATPLALVLENTLEKLAGPFAEKGISVDNRIDVNPILEIDANLAVTALSFILENAIKYSPENSRVILSHDLSQENGLVIHVRDSGKGVPASRINTLFEEFGIEDVSHHGRGHGLSLAIVNYIMELHGGRITVANNTDGAGSTFSLSFPASRLIAEEEPQPAIG